MKAAIAVLFGVIVAALAVARIAHTPTPGTVDWYAAGDTVTVHGTVADEPDRRPLQTKYTIAVTSLTTQSGSTIENLTGKALVSDHRQWPEYTYGDTVAAMGILERPGAIDTFRYDNYLARYGIRSVMYRGSLNDIPLPRNTIPLSLLHKSLYDLKYRFEHRINRIYPEPHASFMAGLLTGSRAGIPERLTEVFNATGLTHIIAISGYNITIVIAIIGGLLFFLPPHIRFYPAIAAIILFTLFVGASAAVVRAAIMGILGLLARQLNRIATARLTVLWAAFLMTVGNPRVLWYDAGFQLSFLAVIGLMETAPLLDPLFRRIPDTLAVRDSLQMTIAAQIAAVPLIIVLFERVSLIAPVANLLVAPAIPFAMLFGSLGTLLSYVSFPLGQLVAYLGWACLEWIIRIATLCASIPFASIDFTMQPTTLISYYGILLGILLLQPPKKLRSKADRHH